MTASDVLLQHMETQKLITLTVSQWYDVMTWYDMIWYMIWYDIWYDTIYDIYDMIWYMIWYDIWYDTIYDIYDMIWYFMHIITK